MAQTFDTTCDAIAAGHATIERRILACLAFEEGLIPLRRIASELGLRSAGHVSDLVQRCRDELKEDVTMRSQWGHIFVLFSVTSRLK